MLASMFTKKLFSEAKVLKNYKPNILILRPGHYFSGLLLGRLWKIPCILEINGPVSELRLAKRHVGNLSIWQWLEKSILLRLPSHITVVSEPLKRYFIDRGIPAKKITTVPNGVDVKRFSPDVSGKKVRQKLGLEGKIVLGFSGTFAPWHGIDFLLKAITKLIDRNPKVKDYSALLLIGRPGLHFVMPDLPKSYAVTTGYISYDEMPSYLAAIDVFIAPYPKIEPFYFSPLKIFEAMAMGKTVVASSQGQICELIEDGISGLLYPPGEMSRFLSKLDIILNDDELRKRLGSAAREKIARDWSWEMNAHKVLHLCEELAGTYCNRAKTHNS